MSSEGVSRLSLSMMNSNDDGGDGDSSLPSVSGTNLFRKKRIIISGYISWLPKVMLVETMHAYS